MSGHIIEDNERTDDVEVDRNILFSKMFLSDFVVTGLTKGNFIYPSPIQTRAIPLGKCGLDLLIQAKSGTGKTLVFTVLILEAFNPDIRHPQSMIIVPTREIAVQVENVLNEIGYSVPGFTAKSFIGGLDIATDRKNLQNCSAIVGTPGRILHLIKNNILNTSEIKTLVLDEADKLMSFPFKVDISSIVKKLNKDRQTIVSSATFYNNVDVELVQFLNEKFIGVTPKKEIPLLKGIKQFVSQIPEEKDNIKDMLAKVKEMGRIFSNLPFRQCLAFANSQSKAESYSNYLNKAGWQSEVIRGGQDQHVRLKTIENLKKFKCRILTATDLVARGIDAENVNLVINIDVPRDSSVYLHRIGRAGRFGTQGIAITLLSSDQDLEKFQKLLFYVGGNEMFAYKFPIENVADLWSFQDQDKYEKVFGKKQNKKDEIFLHTKKSLDFSGSDSTLDGLKDEETEKEILENIVIKAEAEETLDAEMDVSKDYAENVSDLDIKMADIKMEDNVGNMFQNAMEQISFSEDEAEDDGSKIAVKNDDIILENYEEDSSTLVSKPEEKTHEFKREPADGEETKSSANNVDNLFGYVAAQLQFSDDEEEEQEQPEQEIENDTAVNEASLKTALDTLLQEQKEKPGNSDDEDETGFQTPELNIKEEPKTDVNETQNESDTQNKVRDNLVEESVEEFFDHLNAAWDNRTTGDTSSISDMEDERLKCRANNDALFARIMKYKDIDIKQHDKIKPSIDSCSLEVHDDNSEISKTLNTSTIEETQMNVEESLDVVVDEQEILNDSVVRKLRFENAPHELNSNTTGSNVGSNAESSSEEEFEEADKASSYSSDYGSESSSFCKEAGNAEANTKNSIYQRCYTNWTNHYWNQLTQIHDYVRFQNYSKRRNNTYYY